MCNYVNMHATATSTAATLPIPSQSTTHTHATLGPTPLQLAGLCLGVAYSDLI